MKSLLGINNLTFTSAVSSGKLSKVVPRRNPVQVYRFLLFTKPQGRYLVVFQKGNPMTHSQSPNTKFKLKAIAVLVIIALATVGSVAVLSTETSCTYQTTPGGSPRFGQQTYWEKLVGGLCHPLAG